MFMFMCYCACKIVDDTSSSPCSLVCHVEFSVTHTSRVYQRTSIGVFGCLGHVFSFPVWNMCVLHEQRRKRLTALPMIVRSNAYILSATLCLCIYVCFFYVDMCTIFPDLFPTEFCKFVYLSFFYSLEYVPSMQRWWSESTRVNNSISSFLFQVSCRCVYTNQ